MITCKEFENLRDAVVKARTLTDPEIESYVEHMNNCPTGRHTQAGIEKDLGFPEGELSKKADQSLILVKIYTRLLERDGKIAMDLSEEERERYVEEAKRIFKLRKTGRKKRGQQKQ